MKRRRRHWPPFLVVVVILIPLACGNLRGDELQCEMAVSHLTRCCPGFRSEQVRCLYSSGCGDTTYPDFSLDDSACMQSSSCATLVDSGVCDRAQNAATVSAKGDDARRPAEQRVCP